MIQRFGASIPCVDEWQATGQEILQPWTNGTLSLAALFEAHNGDHRIVATRLWEIFWYVINGAWDPQLVMIAKAAIYSAAATIFIHLLAGALPRRRFLAGTILAGLFAFPFSYQNLLWAFQSQFDFFLLAVALGWLVLRGDRPVVALLIAGASFFTLGAGPILAAGYVPYFLAAWIDRRWSPRKATGFAVAAVALVAVGVSLRGAHAAPLAGPSDQARALTALLAWPHSTLVSMVDRLPESERLIPRSVLEFPRAEHSWLHEIARWLHAHPAAVPMLNAAFALVLIAPTIAIAGLVVTRRIRGAEVWGPLGLAGFAFLMLIATAIARAQEKGVPVRYLDVVALSGFAALACAFALRARGPRWRPLVVLWTIVSVPACLATMVGTMATVRQRRPQAWVEAVRQYFPSHNHAIFHRMVAENPNWPLPFISRDIDHLMAMLDDPSFEAIVPKSITAPEQPARPVARAAYQIGRFGLWIVLAALGGGTWIVFRSRRPVEFAATSTAATSTTAVGG
jgi:hypothetical protein